MCCSLKQNDYYNETQAEFAEEKRLAELRSWDDKHECGLSEEAIKKAYDEEPCKNHRSRSPFELIQDVDNMIFNSVKK